MTALRAVLDCARPDLGMTAQRARDFCAEIQTADLGDDDALQAYDLLHNRAVFGRAF